MLFDDESGQAIGCGGLRFVDSGQLEIKRMFVSSRFRRGGHGRQLLQALERRARELGAREVVLDTNATLTPAITMYEQAGYVECEPYNDNRFASKWFKKVLS